MSLQIATTSIEFLSFQKNISEHTTVGWPVPEDLPVPEDSEYYAPVNILPARGGGGHTRGFRQKTIPDRREFDKLMESGSRVI